MGKKKKEDHLIDYLLIALGTCFILLGLYLQVSGQQANGPSLADEIGEHFGKSVKLSSLFFYVLGLMMLVPGIYFILFPHKLKIWRPKKKE